MSHDVIIATACSRIAAHRKIGKLWHKHFRIQQVAAESWLEYQSRHPHATLEQWFSQFDPTVLPKEEPRWAI